MLQPLSAIAAVLVGVIGFPSGGSDVALVRMPKPEKFPPWREQPARPGADAALAPRKQRIFGIGVGFEKSGTLTGVALSIVLPGSPAARGGLVPGCVIAEINGEATVGRVGDDCARLIRESFATVRIKYLDPALKERTITLEKEWIVVPE